MYAMGANHKPRTTVTHSLSFKRRIFEVLEDARTVGLTDVPRTEYVEQALTEKFLRDGWLVVRHGQVERSERRGRASSRPKTSRQ